MSVIVTCDICGKTFAAGKTSKKYCSKECVNASARKRYYEQKGVVRRKEPVNNSLAEIAVAARKAGMTYGQYVGKYGL